MTPALLATLRAAGEAATKGPWYRGQRIISAGIEPRGMEGTGKCALCHPSRPLHSVVPNGYHSEYFEKPCDLHRHIDPEPSGSDHVIQSEDGELVAGTYDYDEGGIVHPADATFIALARNHWGELLDEIDGLRRDLTEAQDGIVELADEIERLKALHASIASESYAAGHLAATQEAERRHADEIERLHRDLENAEIRREHAEKRAREYLLEWQEDDDSRADVLEAAIDENLPEYVLDDGTEEPANYLERIEFAGQEARRAIKYRDERDALRARAAKLDAVAEAARDFASQIDRWQAMEDRAALDAALIALDQEVSRG